jgi:endonuclease-3 related protein
VTGTSAVVEDSDLNSRLLALYEALLGHFGSEPHWWPIITGAPQFEILVGSVLVQQTRWETVEAALARLRDASLLSPAALAAADTGALALLLRPCAFHTQKAPGLQAICRYLVERYGGDVGALLAQPRAPLRAELLALPRIGRETADAIMLFGGAHPLFIVDAYARRLLARLDLAPGFDFMRAPYDTVQQLVENALAGPALEARLSAPAYAPPIYNAQSAHCNFYRNFHALIVEECIHHCLANRPRQDQAGARRRFVDPRKCAAHCLDCAGCPLRGMCATYRSAAILGERTVDAPRRKQEAKVSRSS